MTNFMTISARLSSWHHGLAAIFVTLYGYHVCSIISSLDLLIWAVTLVPVVLIQWTLRCLLTSITPPITSANTPTWAFGIEFSVFALGGIIIGIINAQVHGVPTVNGVKVALSFLALGIFAGLDLAIFTAKERLLKGGLHDSVETVRLSLAAKLSWLIGAMLALAVSIAGALMMRLLEDPGPDTVRTLAIELAVLFLCFVGYISFLIARMRAVVALALAEQLAALDQATSGSRPRRARIAMQDEIGMVSTRVNRMLDTLQLAERQREIANAALLRGLIGLAGARDNETGQHLARTQSYIELIATELAKHPKYVSILTPDVISLYVAAAPLHDIGKVAIPDIVLLKPGKLIDEEFVVMQTHVTHGIRVIDAIIAEAGETPFIMTARDIVGGHHEKFDGSGYPLRLRAQEIPLSARLMALADVYDALRTQRVYKPAFDRTTARQIIIDGAGTHFDPDIVAAFLIVEPALDRLSTSMADLDLKQSSELENTSFAA